MPKHKTHYSGKMYHQNVTLPEELYGKLQLYCFDPRTGKPSRGANSPSMVIARGLELFFAEIQKESNDETNSPQP